jgi:hypothetical protein
MAWNYKTVAAEAVLIAQLLPGNAWRTQPMLATDAGRLLLTCVIVAVSFMVWVLWRFWTDSQH